MSRSQLVDTAGEGHGFTRSGGDASKACGSPSRIPRLGRWRFRRGGRGV
ncbi:YceI family protein [Carbonactinospora thermoautotrophica]|uniref:YceI family protein n=1 Tax=Carbonactinospora thermoautotrophica TaxID=1469144 RepID=A0A132MNA6_9ACTN|nr:YceI family protein [Carbonactinospora thermoautotrophica]